MPLSLVDVAVWLAAFGLAIQLTKGQPIGASPSSRVSLLVLVLLVGLIGNSVPRSVGDGVEYVTMARQLAAGRVPGLTVAELAEAERFATEKLHVPGVSLLRPGLVGFDGRQDFHHFWLYSLFVAPVMRLLDGWDVHPIRSFSIVNVLILVSAFLVVASRCGAVTAVLVLLGPLVWWLDKPHTEILTVGALAVAFATSSDSPLIALTSMGVATAQNPALAPVLIVLAGMSLAAGPRRATVWASAAGALGIASLHPIYYMWHLGGWSPLVGVTMRHVPGRTALLTPLFDLNLGVALAAPLLTAAVVATLIAVGRKGLSSHWTVFGILAASSLLLLVLFAQSPNVNSGGTFGPSRYGLWLMPLAIPVLQLPCRARRLPVVLTTFACLGLGWAIVCSPPQLSDAPLEHSRAASWMFRRWPSLYSPLPEVFTERSHGKDGWRLLPVATKACEKVLLVGEGVADGRWPIPCQPARLPAECAVPGVLCYASRTANGYVFSVAPAQAGFFAEPDRLRSWTASERALWADVLGPYGAELTAQRAGTPGSLIVDAEGVEDFHVLQGHGRLVAWIVHRPGPPARIRLSLGLDGVVQIFDPATRPVRSTGPPERVRGQPWIDLSAPTSLVVVTVPEP